MRALLFVLIVAIGIVPAASAFEAGPLEVTVGPDGDATATLDYSLNWLETVGVYLAQAAPARTLEDLLSSAVGRPISVTALDGGSVALEIPGFARVDREAGSTTFTTPAYDLHRLGARLASHPLAHLVVPDFTPSSIGLTFPDGYTATFDGTAVLPGYSHTV